MSEWMYVGVVNHPHHSPSPPYIQQHPTSNTPYIQHTLHPIHPTSNTQHTHHPATTPPPSIIHSQRSPHVYDLYIKKIPREGQIPKVKDSKEGWSGWQLERFAVGVVRSWSGWQKWGGGGGVLWTFQGTYYSRPLRIADLTRAQFNRLFVKW